MYINIFAGLRGMGKVLRFPTISQKLAEHIQTFARENDCDGARSTGGALGLAEANRSVPHGNAFALCQAKGLAQRQPHGRMGLAHCALTSATARRSPSGEGL